MKRPGTYAFLGHAGTYTHQATLFFAPEDADQLSCTTISEVFEAVDRGRAEYGVVPIENSLAGAVNETLDAFAFTSMSEIVAEHVINIHHSLVVAPGSTLEDIEVIASKPEATGQCRRFIAENLPSRVLRAANSTAEAVLTAKDDPRVAAIATEFAAELYGCDVLATPIEDHFGNQTRFVLIGKNDGSTTEYDKTSLALFLKADKPGALQMILSEFSYGGINLTKVQSRPTKRALGEYMFFVDIEGNMNHPDVKTALDCLRLKLREVKVLGSYPSEDFK